VADNHVFDLRRIEAERLQSTDHFVLDGVVEDRVDDDDAVAGVDRPRGIFGLSEEVQVVKDFRRLAVPLIVLLGAILGSAGARMRLYVQYYGISTDRLYATAFMIWLAIVFVWLAFTVLRSRPRTFATGLVVSGFVVLLTLNFLNPDALVARANLARGDAERTGTAGTDLRYVASLGGDAIPVLVSALTASDSAVDTAAAGDRCAAADILLHLWRGERRARMARTWTQWNIARQRATRAVRAHEAELQQLACPEAPDEPVTRPVSP
jgi:hypothetical protein